MLWTPSPLSPHNNGGLLGLVGPRGVSGFGRSVIHPIFEGHGSSTALTGRRALASDVLTFSRNWKAWKHPATPKGSIYRPFKDSGSKNDIPGILFLEPEFLNGQDTDPLGTEKQPPPFLGLALSVHSVPQKKSSPEEGDPPL